ncbi:McrBC 5-methylcytosine restriction system component [Clostridioides difficile]|nr:McrBC 5-methylcytosine restriction system component [Clostridioides difficile]
MSYFYNVDLAYINREELLDYKFYKNNDRFKDCYSLAKLILLNLSMDNSENNQDAFSILFEINILYEEYIGNLIKSIWNNEFRETYIQDKSKFLLKNEQTGKKTFNLRPDIVLYDSKYESEIIIDTKWKAIEVDSNIFYRSSDIYQMYAYITSYENAKRCILLYPCIKKDKNYSSWRLLKSFKGKFIEAKTVRLDDIKIPYLI